MTQFTRPRFTVAVSSGDATAYCREHGHTLPDARGKCLRCGARTTTDDYLTLLEDDAKKTLASPTDTVIESST